MLYICYIQSIRKAGDAYFKAIPAIFLMQEKGVIDIGRVAPDRINPVFDGITEDQKKP